MTKNQFIALVGRSRCHYSGNLRTMFVKDLTQTEINMYDQSVGFALVPYDGAKHYNAFKRA